MLKFILKQKSTNSADTSLYKILETIIHIFDPFAHISDDLDLLYRDYLSVLNGKRVLIILDDLPSGHIFKFLNPPLSCGLLIATHENLEIPDVYSISLSALSQENSERLLVFICPRIGRFAATLSSLCQNLPLNLCLIAGYVNRNSEIRIEEFIVELEEYFKRSINAENAAVEKILGYIVDHLTSDERILFSQLGVLEDGFSKELLIELANPDTDNEDAVRENIQTHLDAFTSLHFLTYDEDQDYYRMQPIIQDFALKGLGDAPEVWYRLGEIYTSSTNWYNSLANKSADGYLLSVLIFDEHKTTIRNIMKYLLNHPSVERDRIILDFYDLINLFGNTRFAPKEELVELIRGNDRSIYSPG